MMNDQETRVDWVRVTWVRSNCYGHILITIISRIKVILTVKIINNNPDIFPCIFHTKNSI